MGGDVCRASVKLNMKLGMRGMIKDTGLLDTIRSLCINHTSGQDGYANQSLIRLKPEPNQSQDDMLRQ